MKNICLSCPRAKPSGFVKFVPHVWNGCSPTRQGKIFPITAKLSQNTTIKWEKDALGAKKDQPSHGNTPISPQTPLETSPQVLLCSSQTHSPFLLCSPLTFPRIFTQGRLQLLMRIILVWGILFSTEASLYKALCRTPGTCMSLRHPAGKTAREGNQREGDNLDLIKKIGFFGHLKPAVNSQLLEFWFDLFASLLSSPFSGGRKLHLDKIIYCEVILESRAGPQEGAEWHRTTGSWNGLGWKGP